MQDLDAISLLKGNRWVSGVEISPPGVSRDTYKIHVNVSPDGHNLIRDSGIQKLQQQIQRSFLQHGFGAVSLEIRPVADNIWGPTVPKEKQRFPLVLSRLSNFPSERLLLDISPELSWFQGHFPGNPVLAGVVQLHWAVCSSRNLLNLAGVPIEIKRLKFKSIVSPPRVLELALNKLSEDEVQFEFTSLGKVNSLGRLIFQGGAEC